MSVIIKGLNKFYSCRLCPFNNSDYYCLITEGKIDRDDYSCEGECPIVQLPKGHGRLIDEQDAIDTLSVMFSGNDEILNDALECIEQLPEVIEADGGDAE